MATREEIAWAAGLFEGEGCFNAYRRKRKYGRWGVQVRLGMTDRDVVERFCSIVGRGKIRTVKPRVDKPHWKLFHEWTVVGAENVREVINLLGPWLGERRRERAEQVLAVASKIGPHKGLRTHCPHGHPYSGENLILEPRLDGRFSRRCRICRRSQGRERTRRVHGIDPANYRIAA